MQRLALIVIVCAATEASAQAYDCGPKLDKLLDLVTQLESISAEVEAREVNDITADITSYVEYATTCIAKLAGAERAKHEKRYEELRKTLKPRVDAAVAKFNEAKQLAHEASKLATKIWNAPIEPDLEPEIAAFAKRLDDAKNPYLTPAWREPRIAKLRKSLDEQRRKRADAANAAETERIAKNTVLARHAGKLTREDAARPQKVSEAFALATAKDIVFATEASGVSRPDPATDKNSVGERPPNTILPEFKDDGLGSYVYANGRAVGMFLKTERDGMPKYVPALVWEAGPEDGIVVVVTMDGARFLVGAHRLKAGVPPSDGWPRTPIHGSAMSDRELVALAELGVNAKAAATFAAHEKAYEKCAESIWKRSEPEYDRINAANITSSTRRNRIDQLETRIYKSIDASCGKHEQAFTKAALAALREYTQLRAKTLATTRARLESL